MSLPNWLATNERGPLPAARNRWGRADYLEKTLQDVQHLLAEDMYQAVVASEAGLLQQINPRTKVLGVAVLLAAVAGTKSMPLLAALHLLFLGAALASGISLKDYLVRSWLPATVFAGIAMLPATLSWVTPGETVVNVYHGLQVSIGPLMLPAELSITRQGLIAAVMVLLRSAASLGLVVLAVKTTRWPVFTKALSCLGLSGIFVMVLDLTYRYIFLFLLLVTDYLLGRQSRLVGTEGPAARLAWVGSALGGFFRMAAEYGQEVNASMRARGYTGESHQQLQGGMNLADVCFLAAVAAISVIAWGGTLFGRMFGI